MSNDTKRRQRQALLRPIWFTCLLMMMQIGCDSEGGGDSSCPEGTIRSGNSCISAGEEVGGIGPVAGDEAGETHLGQTYLAANVVETSRAIQQASQVVDTTYDHLPDRD